MTGTYSGLLEEQIEKYDLRYDELMEQEEQSLADAVQSDDYVLEAKQIVQEMN